VKRDVVSSFFAVLATVSSVGCGEMARGDTPDESIAAVSQALTYYCKVVTADNLTVWATDDGYNSVDTLH